MKNRKGYYTLCVPFTHKYLQLRVNNNGAAGHRWGGFLRKLNERETFEQSARLSITNRNGDIMGPTFEPMGLLEVHDCKKALKSIYVYRVGGFIPNVDDKSFWLHVDDLSLREMGDADQIWIRLFLQGKKFYLGIYVDADGHQLISSFYEVSNVKIPSV